MSTAITTAFGGMTFNGDMRRNSAVDQELSTFAGRLRFAISKKKTNANQIEVKVGITRQAVYAMLKGSTGKPTWDSLVQLSKHLGVRPQWLADGEAPMHPTPSLDDHEAELIEDYRHLSAAHKRDVADIIKRWAEEDSEAPMSHNYLPRSTRHQ